MTIKYHSNGLWFNKLNETDYQVGLSEKGQDDVGEVMFVELSVKEGSLSKGDAILNVEGAKAVTELTIPFDVTIKSLHKEIEDEPELLNSTAKEENWILVVTDIDEIEIEQLKMEAFTQ